MEGSAISKRWFHEVQDYIYHDKNKIIEPTSMLAYNTGFDVILASLSGDQTLFIPANNFLGHPVLFKGFL